MAISLFMSGHEIEDREKENDGSSGPNALRIISFPLGQLLMCGPRDGKRNYVGPELAAAIISLEWLTWPKHI